MHHNLKGNAMTEYRQSQRRRHVGACTEVLDFCTAALQECVSDTAERKPHDLAAYLPSLQGIAEGMRAFGDIYRHDVPEEEDAGE